MNDKILIYVKSLFKDAPRTQRISEIEEELLSNLNDKYNDLVASGKSEADAYETVVASVGNIDSLIAEEDNFVEDYKKKQKEKKLIGTFSSSFWLLTTIVYFLVSFLFSSWEYSWIIFVIAAALNSVFVSIITKKVQVGSIIWLSAVVLYLILSFTTEKWEITWLVFLAAAALQQILRLVKLWRE